MSTTANGQELTLARGLGWFSIGLGMMEVLAPRGLARMIGVPPRRGLMRMLGLREIANGIAILQRKRPASQALWSRVAGDAMDMGLLGTALISRRSKPGRIATAAVAVAGVAALDVYASQKLSRHDEAIRVERSITIDRTPEDLYAFWRQFENLPKFMEHLQSVTRTAENHSHWVAKGPAGTEVEWDAEIVADRPNELIAWRSLPGSTVVHEGSVRFDRATGGRGTIVRVKINYLPPAGRTGAMIAKMFGEAPEKQVPVELMRFKQLMETGEISRTEGQPAARMRSTSPKFDEPVRR